jgi:glycosyltransferase involved in cell wall biosynthesis
MVDSLTIAIPTYNRCKDLCSLIDSIIPQLDENDELLVVDDASHDQTSEILQSNRRIRLISNPVNVGMVRNWNKCLTSATRDWVCMIHDDDTITPNTLAMIRKAYRLIQKPVLVGHSYKGGRLDSSLRCYIEEPGTWAVLHPLNVPSGVTIHKSIIDDVGIFDERFKYSADIEYFSRICSKYTSVVIENPQILTFNLHGQNYEYKTWSQSDFLLQLEQIEAMMINYAGLNQDAGLDYFRQKMNSYIRYIFNTASKADDKTLLRKVGLMAKNKPYLGKKNLVASHFASMFNWLPRY